MTRVERQTMYLDTFQKLREQAEEKIPSKDLEVWIGGAASMCAALAQKDEEVTEITYTLIWGFLRQMCERYKHYCRSRQEDNE